MSFGGLIATTDKIENFPAAVTFTESEGILGLGGWELMEQMQKQAAYFGAETIYEIVTSVVLSNIEGGDHIVHVGDTEYHTKTLIVATGCSHRHLGIPAEQTFNNKGVSYCATCDAALTRGHKVIVVGGGDSALTEALFLARFAEKVYIVHRRDALRATKILEDRAKRMDKIEFIWNAVVDDITGDESGKVNGVMLKSTVDGSIKKMDAQHVFVAIGHVPNVDLVKGQISLDNEGYILTKGHSMLTSLPGVFAAGDVVDHYYRQAITAAGMGCKAAIDAEKYLQSISL